MMNARAVTETMNIQWRQRNLRYWRKSNVSSGGSVSTLVGTLNPTFIGSDPHYPLRQISDRAMGIAAGDDSKAPAPPVQESQECLFKDDMPRCRRTKVRYRPQRARPSAAAGRHGRDVTDI